MVSLKLNTRFYYIVMQCKIFFFLLTLNKIYGRYYDIELRSNR